MSNGHESESPRFVVVGAAVADCVIRTPRLPEWDNDVRAHSIEMTPGGKGLNQAIALARLGAHVSVLSVVGDDPAGQHVLRVLDHEGVDRSRVVVRPGATTPLCMCLVGEAGETSFIWHIPNDIMLTAAAVRGAERQIAEADTLLINFEVPATAVNAAIGVAAGHGRRVIVQPAPALDVAIHHDIAWQDVDVLVPNATEAVALLGEVHVDAVARSLSDQLGIASVVVTRGSAGCVVHHAGRAHVFDAHPAREVVDTTGASDAFIAALAFHLAGRADFSSAVDHALTAAAWSVSRSGGYRSMPRMADLAP